MRYADTTIIIPTINEEDNIGKLIDTLYKLYPGIKIIVSDDGSVDDTGKIAKKKKAVFLDRSDKNVHGITVSIIDALLKCETKYFVAIDADFQHPPEKIKEIVEKLRKGSDLVVGARISTKGWSIWRRMISKTAYILGYLRLLFKRTPKYDLMSGFFGGKREFVEEIVKKKYNKFELKGYKMLFDLMKYVPVNVRIGKVSYDFGLRKHGSSKLNKKIIYYYFRSLFK